jgi:hypothetical protein
MEFEEFVDLLNEYEIMYDDYTDYVKVYIDDINGITDEFKKQQDEIIDLMNKFSHFGKYTYFSQNI